MKKKMTIADLNAADEATFVGLLGNIFEDSPWIAAAAWKRRPFGDRDALLRAMTAIVDEASPERRTALIAAHPDLVGKAAREGRLSAASRDEQASAGLDRLEPDEVEEFGTLNAAYRERFGLPFVICVRENRKAAILAGMRERLRNGREAEIGAALREIVAIARLRLADMVSP
ncbi:MAG TPA: 2-oxo-4-hydroxy-4-carboxy-5-ureidoimidazoline decarboxylase [Candidatus Baltobacteraceae bacterium]|nr:2-oxo-4-hydroxy-4-carboxy-5-ureidoimidazoline decarboxylase [Candidatus Baltobacteraceae bacterium]